MAYPSGTPSYAGFTSSHTLSADNHAAQHNQEQADITALANKVGTGASTPTSGMLLRGTGAGTSVWGQANLTTDVTGVLPQANGGTGTTSATGSGAAVYQTSPNLTTPVISSPSIAGGGSWTGSPTIATPTIASFINSLHDHTNAAGGGQLGFSALLSTIFSGQVQTQANAGTAGGNMWWINLGGLKILWGKTTRLNGGPSSTYGVALPTFFTTVQAGWCDAGDFGSDFGCKAGFNTAQPTTTTADLAMISPGGDTAIAFWGIIGT